MEVVYAPDDVRENMATAMDAHIRKLYTVSDSDNVTLEASGQQSEGSQSEGCIKPALYRRLAVSSFD